MADPQYVNPEAGTPPPSLSRPLIEPVTIGTAVSPCDPLRVVVLEDDDIDARALDRLLKQAWPSTAEITRFGLLADLEAGMGSLSPDILFCDLSVPDGTGVEVVERAVRCAGLAPVVVLTGNADPAVPILALELGAQDYLSKGSFDADLLARTLRYSMARNHSDRQVKQIAEDLKLLNQHLDQYAGIVAHDLRAPVRTARLFADRMIAASRKGEDPEALGRLLDSNLARLEELIARLLQIATLSDGALDPVGELLSAVVDDIRSDLLADIQASGLVLRVVHDATVVADHTLIRELLRNLVQNSIKYRSPDREPSVDITASGDRGSVTVTVVDNGIGIDPAHWERVFRLFERLDSSGDVPGLGFGLAFCRRIAELHRGSIEIGPPDGEISTSVILALPALVDNGQRA